MPIMNSSKVRATLTLLVMVMVLSTLGCGGGGSETRGADSFGSGDGGAPMSVSVSAGNAYVVSIVGNVALDSATLYFANGANETTSLNGQSAEFTSASDAKLSYLKVLGKSGDYWFFDNA